MFLRDLTEPLESTATPVMTPTANAAVTPAPQTETNSPKIINTSVTSQPGTDRNSSTNAHISDQLQSYSSHQNSLSSHNNELTQSISDKFSTPSSNVSGTALYHFQAESNTELSLEEGQTVTNIQAVDEDWLEGTVNGARGMFPKAFVELIDSSFTEQAQSVEANAVSNLPTATVLYNFVAVNSDEISLTEGQNVTVVCDDVNDWSKVRASDGSEGLCPTDFLDMPACHKQAINDTKPATNGIILRDKSAGKAYP